MFFHKQIVPLKNHQTHFQKYLQKNVIFRTFRLPETPGGPPEPYSLFPVTPRGPFWESGVPFGLLWGPFFAWVEVVTGLFLS